MTKIVCISDTHMAEVLLPPGDYLIHAGDMTFRGSFTELSKQLYWLSKQVPKYKKVIIIPGNHDFGFEKDYGQYYTLAKNYGIIVLNDTEFVHNGIKFYGSPITPEFHSWAFNKERGEEIKLYWDMIPNDTDVLITHGPAYGILDLVPRKRIQTGMDQYYQPIYSYSGLESVGCKDLLNKVKELPNLKAHIFGHLHYCGGQNVKVDNTIFVNASLMTEEYQPKNNIVVIEI